MKEEEINHKHTIDALKDSEEKWRSLTENSPQFIVTVDQDGIIQFANRASTLTREQTIIRTSIYNYIPDKFKQTVKDCIERVKETRKPEKYYIEYILPKDSNVISFESSIGPIIKLDKIIGFIISSTDITEQKIAQDKLKESEELYRTITEYSNDMIWTLDRDGNFIFFNKRSEQISGYKLEELCKSFQSLIIEKDLGKAIDAFHMTLNGQPQQYEVTLINKHNRPITLSVNTAPIYSKGQIIGVISSGRNITETVKIANELKILNEKLAVSNKELQDFAYVASHDLQEPLRTIYGFTELLAENYKGKLDPGADEYIEFITTSARRMQDMINDLLAISRVSTRGKKFLPTDTEKVLDVVFKNLRSLIDKNHAIITHDPLPTIIADDTQITQLFQNLIDNAIKFRREETPKIHISCEQQDKKRNGEWIFSIKDNGIGIDKKQFKKLFIIFQRLHSREEYLGTGIGLAMCKKIVERHRGRIWVESEIDIGSTFYFTIPIIQQDND